MGTPQIARKIAAGQNDLFEVMGDIKRTRRRIAHLLTEKLPVVCVDHETKKALVEYTQELEILAFYARQQAKLAQQYLDTLDN